MTESTGTVERTESQGVTPVGVSQSVVQVYQAMIDQVPDAGQDGMEGILAQLAEATDVGQLDEPWRSGGLGELASRPLRIDSIAKMPAEFDGPIPYFLIVRGYLADTGEKFTASTGAVSVVGQLVRAYAIGAFPLACVLRIADRPSAAGYFPQHLEMIRK